MLTRRRLELGLLLGPALVLFICFVLAPIGVAGYYSLHEWDGFGALEPIGLRNYGDALSDDVFQGAIVHNLIIVALSLAVQLPLSIGLALLLNRRLHGRALLRLVVFAPYVLSEAITAVVWLLLLQPDGFIDALLKAIGLGSLVQQWLADGGIVLYTLFAVITWKYIGFGIILLLAGLQSIPAELREAATLDGASPWQGNRHIVLPLLGPTIRIWIFLSVIGSLQLFDLVWIMTLGGPANASNTMATYLIDRGFRRYEFGFGSAVAVILFVICFAFALAYQRYALRRSAGLPLTYLAALVIVAVTVVPLGFVVLGGFRTTAQLNESATALPDPWVWGNYEGIITSGSFWRFLGNSALIAVLATALAVALGAMAAFALSRYDFKGREAVYTLFTIGLLFPLGVASLPLYLMLRTLGLLENPLGVAIPEAAFSLPVTIVILRPFMRAIPAELEDAAVVDGASRLGFFWRILLPLSTPALVTVAILAFVTSWNQYLLPLLVFNDSAHFTLPLGVATFQSQFSQDTARILAFTALSMVPSLAVFVFAERRIVGGLTGAIKG
jgi:raffinose/stachyose/melibiose transport system permease protein